jgi:hypothetical protein
MVAELWLIYDARAWSGDTDSAAVFSTADTQVEAEKERDEDWPDAVIYGYDCAGDRLVNQRGPF